MLFKIVCAIGIFIAGIVFNIGNCSPNRNPVPGGPGTVNLSFEGADWIKSDFDGSDGNPCRVCTDRNGGIYIAGQAIGYWSGQGDMASPRVVSPNPEFDAYLIKLSPQGDIIWDKWWDYGDLGYINKIACDSSGNIYMIGGYTMGNDFKPDSGHSKSGVSSPENSFLVKVSGDGNFLWRRTWSGDNYLLRDRGLDVTTNDEIYIAGSFFGTVTFDDTDSSLLSPYGERSSFVAKVSSDGEIDWAKLAEVQENLIVKGIRHLSDGSYYLATELEVTTQNEQGSQTNRYPCVTRLDQDMKELWTHEFHSQGGQIFFDDSGYTYFTGWAEDDANYTEGNTSSPDTADSNISGRIVCKINDGGQLVWTIHDESNGILDLAVGFDSSIYTCGVTGNLCKYDPDGKFVWARAAAFEGYGGQLAIASDGSILMSGRSAPEPQISTMYILQMPG